MVVSNFANVPEELKERDQWLLWDSSDFSPRQPHWRGDFGRGDSDFSWSDPDQWHSFEEAVDAAGDRDSWGIGYVTAMDNDDHPRGVYGVIDIDGGNREAGEEKLKDWVPSLEPFVEAGAYIEFSPSGEGLHIPFVGHEPPEWWKDCQLGEHEGVDVLTNKFCTFTGDTVSVSGDEVTDTDPTPWLFEAHEAINGEAPSISPSDEARRTSRESHDGEEFLEETDIEEALDHLDPDASYPEWRDIAFAVHDYDPGSGGKGLFESWSRGGTKWDENSQRYVDAIWESANQGSGVTVGTLIHKAREAGWDMPSPAGDSPPPEPPEPRETDDGGKKAAPLSDWWAYVRDCYDDDRGLGRKEAADVLEKATHWMYVLDSEILWVYDDETGYYNPRGDAYARNVLETELAQYFSTQEANEVIARLQARNQTLRSELNARTRDSKLLCVGNGVVNLETGDVVGHSPEFKFTRGLRWEYDPAGADPEPVLEFLDDVTKREADRDTLLDHLAHGLMPGHPYRAFVMMYGPGSNGKTRVGKLFRGFVGEENAASVELQDLTGDDSFATGGLPGAFINVGDDISIGEIRDTSIIKSLTGDGTIRANEKYEKQYEFENEAAMFFSANEPPRIREKTVAISDRLYPIEMPYRFVDDPQAPHEKRKVPGIAEALMQDEAAMKGLLLLAVKHAQGVIERNGEYSMPEGPEERREMYEAASDPIKRFVLDHMEPASPSSMVLKDDVYTVYTEMCADEGERAASDDVFKQKVGQVASLDLESTRTRSLTPGSDRENAWKYVSFAESAREFMPPRLTARYFGDDEESHQEAENDTREDSTVFSASPVSEAAEALTGYVTVTVEVAAVTRLGEDERGTKAIVKDSTGAVDVVTWDPALGDYLENAEGECIVIKNAEVDEYEGTRQLKPVESLTEMESIQRGVGFTASAGTGDASQKTVTADGGTETATADDSADVSGGYARMKEYLRVNHETDDTVSAAELAARVELPPQTAVDVLRKIANEERILKETEDDREDTYKVQ